jgi:hypothetical protein
LKQSRKIFTSLLLLALGAPGAWAGIYTNVQPDEALYQRVQKLGQEGLLDPRDQAVLDEEKIVSRLELAFYVEKAASNLLSSGEKGVDSPSPSAPLTVAQLPGTRSSRVALRREIRDLLDLLSEEAAYLRAHTSLQSSRLSGREEELEKLRPIQDELDSIWNKANQAGGVPSFNTKGGFRAESLSLSGIAEKSVLSLQNGMSVGMWSDLGGKGSLYFGIGGVVSLSNFSAATAPVSHYTISPAVNIMLDGPLGRWSTHFAVETYQPDTTLGDFVRGAPPSALRRYVNPVNIPNYNDDANTKNWDDYMSNIGFVPLNYLATGKAQSAGDRVFSGFYAIGTGLPLLPSDTRVNVMLGRMGATSTQTQRWEEAVKVYQPLAGGAVRTSVSGLWVNDHFGVNRETQIDLQNYGGDFALVLKPVYFHVQGAYSRLSGGVQDAPTLESGGAQAFLAYYPIAVFYSAIGEGYANFQSKVMMSGVHFDRYGQNFSTNQAGDMYGAVGEVDNLISDRYGWRVNLGWNGRLQDWMKGWPGFLDDFVLNADWAQKAEYTVERSPFGYNVVEPFHMVTFYYPDDEGLWGRELWGGWGPGDYGVYSVRKRYIENLQAIRNDGNTSWDATRHQWQLTSERIPLILPVDGEAVREVGGKPVTFAPGVNNTYTGLPHRKAYHYLTLTAKLRLDKLTGLDKPLYGSVFFTNNVVSGSTSDPVVSKMPDPNRSGETLADVPSLFDQRVVDFALMWQFTKGVNLMGDYGCEWWKSNYTYPLIDYRTDCVGAGLGYDLPWGGGKFELRYKHIVFNDVHVAANCYQGDQFFSTLMLLF